MHMKNILPVFRGLGRVALLLTAGAVLANAQTVSSDTNEASPVKL